MASYSLRGGVGKAMITNSQIGRFFLLPLGLTLGLASGAKVEAQDWLGGLLAGPASMRTYGDSLAAEICEVDGRVKTFSLVASESSTMSELAIRVDEETIWQLAEPSTAGFKTFDLGALVCDVEKKRLLAVVADRAYPLLTVRVFLIPLALDVAHQGNSTSSAKFSFWADRDRCQTSGLRATRIDQKLDLVPVREGNHCTQLVVSLDLASLRFSSRSARATEPRDHFLPFLAGLLEYAEAASAICRVRITQAGPDDFFESGYLSSSALVEALRGSCPEELRLEWGDKSSVQFGAVGGQFVLFLFPIDDGIGSSRAFNPAVGAAQRIITVKLEGGQAESLEVLDPGTLIHLRPVPPELLAHLSLRIPVLGVDTTVKRSLVPLPKFRDWLRATQAPPLVSEAVEVRIRVPGENP